MDGKNTVTAIQLPLFIRLLNQLGSGVGRRVLALNADRFMAEARKQTGLHDFGDESFIEPLRRLTRAYEEEADLSLVGRIAIHRDVMRHLVQRLHIAEDFRRHPEIREVPIQRPLFILGFMRTGTTLLYNLLARMPGAWAPKLWELLWPSPPPDPATEGSDPRIERTRRFTEQAQKAMPALKTIHPLVATAPEECIFALAQSFTDFTAESRAHVPGYMNWLMSADVMVPAYRHYREVLQLLTWKARARHLVLKSPLHLYSLDALLTVFPDARIIQTHRDPRAVVASGCSLYETARVAAARDHEPVELGRQWLDTWGQAMDRAMAVRARASPEQFLDVHYEELMADPAGQVQRIHRWAGLGGEEAASGVVQSWLAENPRNKHGVHQYSLEYYGLDAQRVAERFRAYTERFGVRMA
ncbi:sulfotransferase [Archangium violaceum]|uniref:sulfotransferase family protein n=1 Tax=Archangium violaceum TaxID=83451 RepID=UPI00193C6966|nr:sulfotransferase [Archangium violaceum]QRK12662.1 sulfotransferase [Archangium violaceum]